MSRCSLSNTNSKQLQQMLKDYVPLQKGFPGSCITSVKENPAGLGWVFFLLIIISFVLTHLGWQWFHLAKVLLLA